MANCSNTCRSLLLLLLLLMTLAGPVLTAGELPPNILDAAYVDIRHGFSIRPPVGSQIVPRQSACAPLPLEERSSEELPAGQPHNVLIGPDIPILANWQAVRVPESKELIRFHNAPKNLTLSLCLLVCRQRTDVQAMLDARRAYWAHFPQQASIQQLECDTINSAPAVRAAIAYQPPLHEPNLPADPYVLHESLIQKEDNRFYLLAMACPARAPADPPDYNTLMDAVARTFVSFDRKEQPRRWRQARRRAEQALADAPFDRLKLLLQDQLYFRITAQGRNIGFRCLGETLLTGEAAPALRISEHTCLRGGPDAARFITGLGWSRSLAGAALPCLDGSVSLDLQAQFSLASDLKKHDFQVQISTSADQAPFAHETATGEAGTLHVTYFEDPNDPEKSRSIQAKTDEALFTPWALAYLLGRACDLRVNDEFLFQTYSNHALRWRTLRVAAQTDLTITDETPSGDNSPAKTVSVPVFYLVEQTGADGPITETWIDQKGTVLKQRIEGITLLRSTAEELTGLYGDTFTPAETAANP